MLKLKKVYRATLINHCIIEMIKFDFRVILLEVPLWLLGELNIYKTIF